MEFKKNNTYKYKGQTVKLIKYGKLFGTVRTEAGKKIEVKLNELESYD